MKKKRKAAKKITASYEEGLRKRLKDPEYAAEYLTACFESKEGNAEELFLMALRDVAKAHSFQTVAKKAKLGRESLYKAISNKGNPKLSTLTAILQAVGIKINFESQKAA